MTTELDGIDFKCLDLAGNSLNGMQDNVGSYHPNNGYGNPTANFRGNQLSNYDPRVYNGNGHIGRHTNGYTQNGGTGTYMKMDNMSVNFNNNYPPTGYPNSPPCTTPQTPPNNLPPSNNMPQMPQKMDFSMITKLPHFAIDSIYAKLYPSYKAPPPASSSGSMFGVVQPPPPIAKSMYDAHMAIYDYSGASKSVV